MQSKRDSHAVQARLSHPTKSSPDKEASITVFMPVNQKFSIDMEMFTDSTMGSCISQSAVGYPGMMSLTKIDFKDLVAAEVEGVEENYIKGFEC